MEAVLAGDDLRPPRRGAPELQCRLDCLAARAREQHASEGRGRAFQQRAGQQTRERRDAELHFPRRLQLERLDQRRPNPRVVAADVVHPEPAEQVEIPRTAHVVEVGTPRPRPAAVEADRSQQADELRVDSPCVEVEFLPRMLVEQLSKSHAVVVFGRVTIRAETIAVLRTQHAVSVSSHSPVGHGESSSGSREPIRIETARCAEISAGSNRMCVLASASVTSTASGTPACSMSHAAVSVSSAGCVPSTPRGYYA